ncbi:MAG: hypothetical protein Q8J99_06890 [Sulfuritalea sp.]|nr:hypothetical protein [Sulfuritalea sp.]
MNPEVDEDGNPRASADLTLHTAGILIEKMRDLLAKACFRYAVAKCRFQALCQRIGHRTLGHLCGGINREESDFLTPYCPVESL